jgi:tetratricopeptide (TPR) repeat protein
MGNIFISYRREDSAGHTGRLFDRLSEHFGKGRVFMDISGIEPGVDFVEAIDKAVGSCDAFVVVVGKQWLNVKDADGRRRLDNPEDFIRLELATALRRNVRIIPVLVQGATAPSSGNLPEDLKKLSRLQAHEISDNRWDYDVGTLIETLEKVLKKEVTNDKEKEEDKIQPIPPPPPPRFPRWTIAVIAAIVIGIGVYAIWQLGKSGIEMPNVVGQPFEEAKAMLTEKGLEVLREEKPTDEKPPGIVIDQEPKSGAEIRSRSKVQLFVAVKPAEPPKVETEKTVTVPNVLGMTKEEAADKLKGLGLRIGSARRQKSDKRSGTILDQKPGPGSQLVQQGVVDLVIAEEITPPIPPGSTKKDAVNYFNQGLTSYREKKLDDAMNYFQKAIDLDPKYAPAYSGLGDVFRAQRKYDEAMRYYKKAIELDPKNAMAYAGMGDSYYYTKNLDEAIKYYEKAIALDPKYAPAFSALGSALYGQRRYDDAARYYQKAIELDPKDLRPYMMLGRISHYQKKPDEAVKWYQKAIDLDPRYVSAYGDLGDVFYEQKRYDDAIRCYQKVVELNPKDSKTLVRIGNVFLAQRRDDEAVRYYQRAIDLNPKYVPAYYDLGKILTGQKRYDEALRYYQKAAELDPKNPTVYLNLAFTLRNLKRNDEAMKNCQKAMELNPNIKKCW